METEEESPTNVAAPNTAGSNNGAAELKRSSRGTWVQQWEQLERTYFRPLSVADLEDLSAQVRWSGGSLSMTRGVALTDSFPFPFASPPNSSGAWKKWNK